MEDGVDGGAAEAIGELRAKPLALGDFFNKNNAFLCTFRLK